MIISGYILLIAGALLMLTGSVGLLRMPDFYTRLHPVGVSDSLGAPLMILGTACFVGTTAATIKLVMLALFMFITGPTACHALAKAAHASGLVPWGLKQDKPETESSPDQSPHEIAKEDPAHAPHS
ncbi:MAG: monovalent cation/H(+) antiporter subunit G [Alphaproteobacteria bacterium]|nr:monovalent cation/H(+) antiporter subunit G [Alphaproteobacteria bacterium]